MNNRNVISAIFSLLSIIFISCNFSLEGKMEAVIKKLDPDVSISDISYEKTSIKFYWWEKRHYYSLDKLESIRGIRDVTQMANNVVDGSSSESINKLIDGYIKSGKRDDSLVDILDRRYTCEKCPDTEVYKIYYKRAGKPDSIYLNIDLTPIKGTIK